MKPASLRWLALVAVLVAGGLIAIPLTVQAEDDDTDSLAALGKILAGTKGKLAKAIATAEAKGAGIAFEAEVEVENGRTIYEVLVYVGGDEAKVLEIEIDAATGEVLEVENAADDDDDDEADDADDADDKDDDDGKDD